jgi:hypothetical protein
MRIVVLGKYKTLIIVRSVIVLGDKWKQKSDCIDPKLIYQHHAGREGPIIKYFFTLRPDLKPVQDEDGSWHGLLVPQARLLTDLRDFHLLKQVVSCGRGFGKTMLGAAAGLYYSDEYSTEIGKPLNVLIVSSQDALFDNIRIFFRNREDLQKRLLIHSAVDVIPKKGLEFKDTHSRLIPVKATIKAVEGNRADVIIFDETQDIDTAVILKALGCLKKDQLGIVIFLGTPYTEKKSGRPWFIQLVNDPKHFVKGIPFHLTQHSSDVTGGWNDVDVWKASWSKERWNAECLGKTTENKEKSYFGGENVDACCRDVEADPIGGMNATREAGIDCGFHNTTYILTERVGSVLRNILYIGWWKDQSIEAIAPEIGCLLNQHRPTITKIDSKTGSIADYRSIIHNYYKGRIDKVDASKTFANEDKTMITIKAAMRGQLRRKVGESHNLIIPMRLKFADELVKQMLKYNIYHKEVDDLVDALMLSCYEPPKGASGEHGCAVFLGPPIIMRRKSIFG